MKKEITKLSKVGFLILSIALLFASCTKEEYYPTVYPEGEFAVVTHFQTEVVASEWKWNSNNDRYMVSKSYTDLQKDPYENGVVVGNVYIVETQNGNSVEKAYPLPYIKTWIDKGIIYTETISCALSYDMKNVEFYIERSDKSGNKDDLKGYTFKVDIVSNYHYN